MGSNTMVKGLNNIDSINANKLGLVKSELIEILATKNPLIRSQDVSEGVDIILNKISTALTEDDKTEIRGFGSFRLRRYASRTSRNPRTGEEFVKENSFRIYFRASSAFHDCLNPIEKHSSAQLKIDRNSQVNKEILSSKCVSELNGDRARRNALGDTEVGAQPIEHDRHQKIA